MAVEAFLVRFREAVGIADSDWLKLAPGVSVLTGRNNVGKTRVLKSVNELQAASNLRPTYGAPSRSNAPQVRLEAKDWALEADIRQTTLDGYALNPTSYTVVTKGSGTYFDMRWVRAPQAGGVAIEYGAAGSGRAQIAVGNVLPFREMGFLIEKPEVIAAIDRLIYIPPERPVKADHPAIPVPVPKPDGSDLPQALYNHIANVTPQWSELEAVFFEMFPEIGDVIAAPLPNSTNISLRLRDKFAISDISLDDVGTGLARMLHLIACVLLYPAGRLFLIDEPTTHLHPGSEKVLAAFLKKHKEHDYVISTHSPIFIGSIQPDRGWLMIRDQRGSVIQPAFSEQAGRQHVFQELGVSVGDIAIAERLLFVEGVTDRLVYPILLAKLGWDLVALNCEVIDLTGADLATPIQHGVDQLAKVINVRYLFYLDGDKARDLKGDAVKYLPLPEIEDVFLLDPAAVHAGVQDVFSLEQPELLEAWLRGWPIERVADYITAAQKTHKGKKILIDLAQDMKFNYRPRVFGPAIARAMKPETVEFLRKDFASLFS